MGPSSRAAAWLMLLAGVGLSILMVAALLPPGALPRWPLGRMPETVPVFFPDSASWRDFRLGALACQRRGLIRIETDAPDVLVVRTAGGRRLRFAWEGEAGAQGIRDALGRHLRAEVPPLAVVGSINSALTGTLARALAAWGAAHPGAPAPPLLIPAATAVEVTEEGADPARSAPLLGLYPGRAFRVCLNNRAMARLAVAWALAAGAARPARSLVVIDPDDPFSGDLGCCFAAALAARDPGPPARLLPVAVTGRGTIADADFEALAAAVARAAAPAPADAPGDRRPVWVLLTLQGDPARDVLERLAARFGGPAAPPLRVLCGDGIGLSTLESFRGRLPFPLACVASGGPGGYNGSGTGQVEAEVIAALVATADAEADGRAADLAPALRALALPPDSPRALGRSLAFDAEGERAGDDLGLVLECPAGPGEIRGHQPAGAAGWRSFRWHGGRWEPAGAEALAAR